MATFVLIHGSFHGGWCWDAVTKRLMARGHNVATLTLGWARETSQVHSLESSIEDISAVAGSVEGESIILVGHCVAGMLLAAAAQACSKLVSACVYLDAFVPETGECAFDLLGDMGGVLRAEAKDNDGLIPPPPPEVLGLTGKSARAAGPHLRPMPASTHEAPALLSATSDHPWRSVFIRCAKFPGFESQERRARHAGWSVETLNCGHDAMLIAPRRTSACLHKIAKSLH